MDAAQKAAEVIKQFTVRSRRVLHLLTAALRRLWTVMVYRAVCPTL